NFCPLMMTVCPALCPPAYRATTANRSDRTSTILPLPSSPHWAPTTTAVFARISTLVIPTASGAQRQTQSRDLLLENQRSPVLFIRFKGEWRCSGAPSFARFLREGWEVRTQSTALSLLRAVHSDSISTAPTLPVA